MKKALSVMMATAMAAAALTGCGGGSSSETQAPASNGGAAETKAAAAASGEKAEDVFWTVMACPASSALYPFWVSIGEGIPSVFPHPPVHGNPGADPSAGPARHFDG